MDATIREFYLATGMEPVAVYGVPNPNRTADDPPWRLVWLKHAESAPPSPAAAGVPNGVLITEFLQRFEDGEDNQAADSDDVDHAILLVGWWPDGAGCAWSAADPLPLPAGDPKVGAELRVEVNDYGLHLITEGDGPRFTICFGIDNCVVKALSSLLDRAQRQIGAHVWLDDRDGEAGFAYVWDQPAGQVRLRVCWPQAGETKVLDIVTNNAHLISSLGAAIAAATS